MYIQQKSFSDSLIGVREYKFRVVLVLEDKFFLNFKGGWVMKFIKNTLFN